MIIYYLLGLYMYLSIYLYIYIFIFFMCFSLVHFLYSRYVVLAYIRFPYKSSSHT